MILRCFILASCKYFFRDPIKSIVTITNISKYINSIFNFFGNGKVDHTPLKCFGTVWYDRLKEKIDEILGKEKIEKPGVSIPQRKQDDANKRKPEAKNTSVRTENRKYYGYEPTNIGMTFDSEYHSQKRVKTYWKYYYGEEEDLDLNKVIKDI